MPGDDMERKNEGLARFRSAHESMGDTCGKLGARCNFQLEREGDP